MIRLVAIAASVLVSGLAIAGPILLADVKRATEQCSAPLSAYQAVSRLGSQGNRQGVTHDQPAMTLSPGQIRSLQVGEGAN